jgi:hypothetical protein
MTSNESWGTIGLPPILVVCDYHKDSGRTSLEQASSEGLLFMTRPQLIVYRVILCEQYLIREEAASMCILEEVIASASKRVIPSQIGACREQARICEPRRSPAILTKQQRADWCPEKFDSGLRVYCYEKSVE